MEKHTLLKINDLVVEYAANKKIVQAVNGVSLSPVSYTHLTLPTT